MDNQHTSFTLYTICCKEKSKFSSFCKITNTARKAGKQIAQMDWLLITRSIKSQICCLLRDFKVGLLLNIWFPQMRENPLKHVANVGRTLERLGEARFDVIFGGMISQFLQRIVSSSWLPFFWFICELLWLPTCQLLISMHLQTYCPTLLYEPGNCYFTIIGLFCPMPTGGFSQWVMLATYMKGREKMKLGYIFCRSLLLGNYGLTASPHCSC